MSASEKTMEPQRLVLEQGNRIPWKWNSNRMIKWIQNRYRAYREAQKKRGRRKRALQRLDGMMNFYRQFVRSGDLCFDVGANMGNRSEAFLKLGARVVAVEPQPECAGILSEKFRGDPHFTLVQKGLAPQEGQATIHVGNASTLGSMSQAWIQKVQDAHLFEGCTWERKLVVPTTTLDILISQFGVPDFCKIDVEGFEFEVLRGLSQPIGGVSLEYTLAVLDPAIQSIRRLASLGMTQFNYSEGESMTLALPEWVDAETMVGVLTHPERTVKFGDVYSRRSSAKA
jgi:FkbM family methyltransferase